MKTAFIVVLAVVCPVVLVYFIIFGFKAKEKKVFSATNEEVKKRAVSAKRYTAAVAKTAKVNSGLRLIRVGEKLAK